MGASTAQGVAPLNSAHRFSSGSPQADYAGTKQTYSRPGVSGSAGRKDGSAAGPRSPSPEKPYVLPEAPKPFWEPLYPDNFVPDTYYPYGEFVTNVARHTES